MTGYTVEEVMGQSAFRYIHPDDLPKVLKTFAEGISTPGAVRTVQYRLKHKSGEWHHYEITGHNMLDDPHVNGIVANYRDITERIQMNIALHESEEKYRRIYENLEDMHYQTDYHGILTDISPSVEKQTGYKQVEVIGHNVVEFYAFAEDYEALVAVIEEKGSVNDFEARLKRKDGNLVFVSITARAVFDSAGQPVKSEGVIRNITDRKLAEENLLRRAHELEALAAASAALRAAQNVTEMVPILAKQALCAVEGDRSYIFLLESGSGDFVSQGWYSADDGFNKTMLDESDLRYRLGEGIIGHVVLSGNIYLSEDIHNDPILLESDRERMKGLQSGISLPLRAKEEIIGVLNVWMKTQRKFNETEIRLLTTLAETAGNAIHRSMLFEQTLQHADELSHAYDDTLAGWARALELRDEITEGHTRRVTELTMKLARALNVLEEQLIHIRRGALLHDIGKMGIPDSILHKPGPFTVQERVIMEQHTQHAHDMLSAISFLRPALDIPYCHHEYWDGHGYPRKLSGEQIPLAARIFTVVDVWDALTSDRPYRPAWSKEKARDYIVERAGKQFEARIVETFFSLDID